MPAYTSNRARPTIGHIHTRYRWVDVDGDRRSLLLCWVRGRGTSRIHRWVRAAPFCRSRAAIFWKYQAQTLWGMLLCDNAPSTRFFTSTARKCSIARLTKLPRSRSCLGMTTRSFCCAGVARAFLATNQIAPAATAHSGHFSGQGRHSYKHLFDVAPGYPSTDDNGSQRPSS
jgi:hypothetical protein